MIVMTLSDCPPKLRGDLSKWLCEINTGVYVGNLSARVREMLWQRVCESVRSGRATMVFSAPGEQKMDFRVHNTTWKPVDFDGIKLMQRPIQSQAKANVQSDEITKNFSKASKYQMMRKLDAARQARQSSEEYVVVDIETTGLDVVRNEIIEIAALCIGNGQVIAQYASLVQIKGSLPHDISALTGIQAIQLQSEGRPLEAVLRDVLLFIGDRRIVCHNATFDYGFLKSSCDRLGLAFRNSCTDTLLLSRRKIAMVEDYKLYTLAAHFGMTIKAKHRALDDCFLTYQLFEKLKEI